MSAVVSPNATASIDGLQAKFIDVDGIRTRYYEVGTGEPMVLWHGANPDGTASANAWSRNIAGLAKKHRVIAADKLMSGMTDNPKREEDYTIEKQVEHAWAFQRKVGADAGVHMVGQSRGGYLATRLTLEHPEAVRSLVIVDSATLAPEVGDYQERRRAQFPDREKLDYATRMRTGWERLSNGDTSHLSEEFVQASVFMGGQPKARETERVMEASGNRSFNGSINKQKEESLRWILEGRIARIPTLCYWGEKDPTAILDQGLALFRLLAETNENARMIVVAKVGHFHFRQRPDEFVANVLAFVERFAP